MSLLPYSCLPFGNLHLRAAAKCADFSSGKITPITPSNFITSPPGMEDVDTKATPKTPLDMPPAQQTPTEQALGADADTLALRDEQAKLQAEDQKLQQQMVTEKQRAVPFSGVEFHDHS